MKRANGEGTIYQRSDGRWVGSAIVLTPAGTRKRRDVYGRTRKEAHEKLTALLRLTHQGVPAAGDGRRVGEYLTRWLTEVARSRLRPTTYRTYEQCVRLHLVPGLGRKRLDRLAPADVRAFLSGKQAEGLSPRSVQYLHAVLRAALQQAVRDDLIARNVARLVTPPPVHRDEVRPLDELEARALLAAAAGDRLYALYAVALGVGLRRGEALGLAWTDVDLDEGVLRVRQALYRVNGRMELLPPKTARSRRTVPLPPICVEALRSHRARQAEDKAAAGPRWRESGLVFTTEIGTPIDPSNLSR